MLSFGATGDTEKELVEILQRPNITEIQKNYLKKLESLNVKVSIRKHTLNNLQLKLKYFF